jgi:hypothetical protein
MFLPLQKKSIITEKKLSGDPEQKGIGDAPTFVSLG